MFFVSYGVLTPTIAESTMEKVHEPKEIDVAGAARGVWLVKVIKSPP